jgi:hypothetical protein
VLCVITLTFEDRDNEKEDDKKRRPTKKSRLNLRDDRQKKKERIPE